MAGMAEYVTEYVTSCCDDPLDINACFLQEVDREATAPSRAGPGHAGLARQHGDGRGLDGPDTRHRLFVWPATWTPKNHTHTSIHKMILK